MLIKWYNMARIRFIAGLFDIADGIIMILSLGFVWSNMSSAYFLTELPRQNLKALGKKSSGSMWSKKVFGTDSIFSNFTVSLGGLVVIAQGIVAILTLGLLHIRIKYAYIAAAARRHHVRGK